MTLSCRHSYYIKLGRAGCWEADSIRQGKLRIGWRGQSLADIEAGRWDLIESQLRAEQVGKQQVASTDLNRLKDLASSGPDDIWVTFHEAKLWWVRVDGDGVFEDDTSKYLRTQGAWSDRSLNGRLLIASELPGKLAQLQAFRGTVCKVQEQSLLLRVLEGSRSTLATQMAQGRAAMVLHMAAAIRELHWKDYETLVDLVFRHAGWQRVSILGQQVKGYDLELREPITRDKVVVQVKSRAGSAELRSTASQFSPADYRKVFFVVHSPDADLIAEDSIPDHVELVAPEHLADLAIDAGLSRWLEDKMA